MSSKTRLAIFELLKTSTIQPVSEEYRFLDNKEYLTFEINAAINEILASVSLADPRFDHFLDGLSSLLIAYNSADVELFHPAFVELVQDLEQYDLDAALERIREPSRFDSQIMQKASQILLELRSQNQILRN